MQFTRIGDLDVVTRITGPHHNYLGIQFTPDIATAAPVLERISGDGSSIEPLTPDAGDAIWQEIVDGVSEGNRQLGTSYSIRRARICAGDPISKGVYGQLAHALLEHAVERDQAQGKDCGRAVQVGGEGIRLVGPMSGKVASQPGPPAKETGHFINANE